MAVGFMVMLFVNVSPPECFDSTMTRLFQYGFCTFSTA